jgi:DNA phosphorothioation-associated putative methyltransferase
MSTVNAGKELDDQRALLAARGRTAIQRYKCSRPIAVALAQGVITEDSTVFDYGCGRGDDLAYLKKRKIKVGGWDPNHRPRGKVTTAEVVNLGYVLNVIESPTERAEILGKAHDLATRVLVVAVRVDDALEAAAEFADGCVTASGTFQKIYDQQEFAAYLEQHLETRPHLAAPGIAYVFKDAETEAAYLAHRAFSRRLEYRTELIEDFGEDETALAFVEAANDLGRLPLPEEFDTYSNLLAKFGSQQRVSRLAYHYVDRSRFDALYEERREDILTLLATMRLQQMNLPPLAKLSPDVRGDIKDIWGSYKEAVFEADGFLFSLGNEDRVIAECTAASVGKLVQDDLYIHRSSSEDVSALLRIILVAARAIVGEIEHDLVKIKTDGRAVSFLKYEDFDGVAHPALRYSVRVHLPRAKYRVTNYTKSANPPILHRKDAFVSDDYPLYEQFRQLSEAEEARGLLSRTDIGNRRAWEELLDAEGVTITGHSLADRAEGTRTEG